MRSLAIGTVLVAAAAGLAHLHGVAQEYQPVVTVAAPEGVTYTAVLDAAPDRPACGAAAKRFVEPVRDQCPQCVVVSVRCEREAAGAEFPMPPGAPVVAVLKGVWVAIAADEGRARASCDLLVSDALRRGMNQAACVVRHSGAAPLPRT